MKTDLELAVENSRDFELLLSERFGVRRQGLGKMLKSVSKEELPRCLYLTLRKIAWLRNSVVHRDSKLKNKDDFIEMCEAVRTDLNALPQRPSTGMKKGSEKKTAKQTAAKEKRVLTAKKAAEPVPSISVKEASKPFDPFGVNLENIGTFGSDSYKQ